MIKLKAKQRYFVTKTKWVVYNPLTGWEHTNFGHGFDTKEDAINLVTR